MERPGTISNKIPKFKKTATGEMFNTHNYTSKDQIQTSNKFITINQPCENLHTERCNEKTMANFSSSGMVNINNLIKSS